LGDYKQCETCSNTVEYPSIITSINSRPTTFSAALPILQAGHVIMTNTCTLTIDNYTGKVSKLIIWWLNCWSKKEIPIFTKSLCYMKARQRLISWCVKSTFVSLFIYPNCWC